jgi:signal transduction histidine kinase
MTTASPTDHTMPRWQRSLLPAVLGADHADRGGSAGQHLPRTLRDWVVDLIMFGFALALGAAGAWQDSKTAAPGWMVIDVVVGLAACGLVWVRRDHPLAVGVATVVVSGFSGMAGGAAVCGIFTVAIYCVPRRTIQVVVLSFVASGVYAALYMPNGRYRLGDAVIGVIAAIAAAAFGLFVRARRELVLSLRERNRSLQADQEWRVQEARRAERDRIAREMHDVLAHRISLLSLHAGALEFHPDASPEEIARAAGVIRVSARAAQEELREVIGVLRADLADVADAEAETGDEQLEPPQPRLADLNALVDESRRAGMDVCLDANIDADALPDTLGRTVYRLIQEALTNARKHAPGQLAAIELSVVDSDRVRVAVTNSPMVGAAPDGPAHAHVGSGTGLIGIGERVALAGGTLRHGSLPGGGYELVVELPWT